MQAGIRSFLKKTPLYPLYRRYQQHRKLQTEVSRTRVWTVDDENRAAFYQQFISPGDLVFDVGANLGNRTKVFNRLGAEVVAFEPQADCFQVLEALFHGNPSVHLVNRALGKTEGEAEMLISDAHTISSLSPQWIAAVKDSGRFREYQWDQRQRIQMTTIDKMIGEFGVPSFIKIDVEGYECDVLSKLSTPIDCVSIEFVPEVIQNTLHCIDHMSALSEIDARLSLEESMQWATPTWQTADEIKQVLRETDRATFGDVYIRCLKNRS
jgi:FkbM family methyltransferase